ncbi:hypothetical protein TNCV_1757011 [Trichonephila clavipes]|nr:hypothetical protein TNCV_1757011 [Trichonephila clavipes]
MNRVSSASFNPLRRQVALFISKAACYESICMLLNRHNDQINNASVDVLRREEGMSADSLNLEYIHVFENTRFLYEKYRKLIRSMKFVHTRMRRNFRLIRNIYLNLAHPPGELTDRQLNVLEDFTTSVWLLAHVLQAIYIIIDNLTHNLTHASEILKTFIYCEIWGNECADVLAKMALNLDQTSTVTSEDADAVAERKISNKRFIKPTIPERNCPINLSTIGRLH